MSDCLCGTLLSWFLGAMQPVLSLVLTVVSLGLGVAASLGSDLWYPEGPDPWCSEGMRVTALLASDLAS